MGTHVESMLQYFILFLCCVLFFAELLHCVSDFVTYLANPFGVPDADLRLLSWTLMVIACCSVQTRRWNRNYMLFRNSVSFELLVLSSVSFKSRSWLSSSKSILLNILCGVHAARLSVKDDHHVFLACSATTPTILGDLRASARISVRTIARAQWVVPRATRARREEGLCACYCMIG